MLLGEGTSGITDTGIYWCNQKTVKTLAVSKLNRKFAAKL